MLTSKGSRRFTQVRGPRKVTPLRPACLVCIYESITRVPSRRMLRWDLVSACFAQDLVPVRVTPRWRVPDIGWAKLNIDACFDPNSGAACAGGIIRNCRGEVFLSSWTVLPNCTSPAEAEILACGWGLRLARDWIDMPMVIEGDCADLIDGLKTKDRDKAIYGHLLLDVKAVLADLLAFRVSLVKRECNRVAHELAQLAKSG